MICKNIKKLHFYQYNKLSTSRKGNDNEDISNLWSWVPPQNNVINKSPIKESYKIPIIKHQLLAANEIEQSLISLGAEDVVIIKLAQKLDTIDSFVVASGRSTRHLRKMATSIVESIKDRELRKVIGFRGIEGDKDDDWQLIDSFNIAVHLMLPKTRKHLDIESHWTSKERPTIAYTQNENLYEKQFQNLLDRYPCPADYMDGDQGVKEEKTIKKL